MLRMRELSYKYSPLYHAYMSKIRSWWMITSWGKLSRCNPIID
jgi:hypothetical protein